MTVLLGAQGQFLGQLVRVKAAFDAAQVVDAGAGLHPAWREQRAAVLIGQFGDRQGADAAGLGHDLGLVPADQRAQDRQFHGVVERGDVGERLAAHLAERVAGDQRGAAEPPGERLARLEHQPPLRHDLQPVRAGGRQRLLGLAERHHEQPRSALEPVQPAYQRVGLVDRFGAGQRHAGEMQEEAAQATPHHPVRGHRRVDAAGHERDTAAAHPHRQPALPGQDVGEHEDLIGVHLDVDRGVRVGEVDRQPVRVLDFPADQHGQLRGRQREALVPAARPHGERARFLRGQRHRGGGDRLGRLRHPQRLADRDDARHVPHPFSDLADGLRPAGFATPLTVSDAQQDDPFSLPQIDGDADLAHRRPDVAVQYVLELLPVPPLEHDLAQLEQNTRLIRAFARFGGGELWHPPSLPAEIGRPERERGAFLRPVLGPASGENRVLAPVFSASSVDTVAAWA
jgi:hypothetical protein